MKTLTSEQSNECGLKVICACSCVWLSVSVEERERRHNGEPSLQGGGWGINLMSGVRLNGVLTKRGINRIKQDFLYFKTRVKLCITDSLEDIQKCGKWDLNGIRGVCA